jgi:hypothetical protein
MPNAITSADWVCIWGLSILVDRSTYATQIRATTTTIVWTGGTTTPVSALKGSQGPTASFHQKP